MRMKNKYLLNMDYNQEQRKIANAIEQLALLFHMASDENNKKQLAELREHAGAYRVRFYPDVWRPENKQQEERPWDSEVK